MESPAFLGDFQPRRIFPPGCLHRHIPTAEKSLIRVAGLCETCISEIPLHRDNENRQYELASPSHICGTPSRQPSLPHRGNSRSGSALTPCWVAPTISSMYGRSASVGNRLQDQVGASFLPGQRRCERQSSQIHQHHTYAQCRANLGWLNKKVESN